jgi:stage V sporulation protein SpoVS
VMEVAFPLEIVKAVGQLAPKRVNHTLRGSLKLSSLIQGMGNFVLNQSIVDLAWAHVLLTLTANSNCLNVLPNVKNLKIGSGHNCQLNQVLEPLALF